MPGRRHVPHVLRSVDRLHARPQRFFQKRLDMLSTAIAVSHSTTVALNRYFDADWQIIPNGIDTDVFHPSAPPPPGIDKDVPTILFLGRFDPRNGLTTLIDSFRRVKGRGNRGREAQLVVVGDGPLREHYYKQANGDKDITFVGAVLEGRPSYYAHSSVYACPTTKASFGITLLESMACETPVVCSDILGFRDVVVDGREALMVPCGDRDALADALVRVLDDRGPGDPARHHRASEVARILVGACHVSRAGRVSERSRERRRRSMILGLGVGVAAARRRRARRVSPQQSDLRPAASRACRGARSRRRAHVRRRPESRRDAAHPRRARASAA